MLVSTPLKTVPPLKVLADFVEKTVPSFFLNSFGDGRYSFVGLKCERVIVSGLPPLTKDKPINQKFPWPFSGGWVGFLTYEYKGSAGGEHQSWWMECVEFLVIDHEEQKAFLVCPSTCEVLEKAAFYENLFSQRVSWENTGTLICKKVPSFDQYQKKFLAVKNYLMAGDVYQINLTDRFEFEFSGKSAFLYHALAMAVPAPYGAYFNCGSFEVMSFSPELLLSFSPQKAFTQPIKGTRARKTDVIEDEGIRQELKANPKDRAELLMITDLARNDLGTFCVYGTVKVAPLVKIETYSYVHHLSACIEGVPREGTLALEALMAVFPGGSVTGAPKKRAMEIIAELESTPRGIYTGALGYVSQEGKAVFNLPIRTLVKKGETLIYGAGGGIVIDSHLESEYEEMLTKARGLFAPLGAQF